MSDVAGCEMNGLPPAPPVPPDPPVAICIESSPHPAARSATVKTRLNRSMRLRPSPTTNAIRKSEPNLDLRAGEARTDDGRHLGALADLGASFVKPQNCSRHGRGAGDAEHHVGDQALVFGILALVEKPRIG